MFLGLNLIFGIFPKFINNKDIFDLAETILAIGIEILGNWGTGFGIVPTEQLMESSYNLFAELLGQLVGMGYWMILLQNANGLDTFAVLRAYTLLLGLVHLFIARGIRAI